jgi:hypothetical protein
MKIFRYTLFIIMLLGMIMVSCSDSSDVAEDTSSPALECKILFNVEKPAGMRMADAVVQTEGQAFRGLQSLLVVPFKTNGDDVPVTASDVPLLSSVNNAQKVTNANNNNLYYVVSCSLMKGVNRVLAYGRTAYAENLAAEKDNGALEIRYNGALATSLRDRMNPSELTFNLKSICNTTDAHDDAKALAAYLTSIAKTDGWSTTTDGQLKDYYRDFINIDGEGTGIIAGSATNVKAYADALKTQITAIKDLSTTPETSKTLCGKILASINDNTAISGNTYPVALGLPDGVAALRWMEDVTETAEDKYKFMVRTQTTTMDNINGINRYTYPAELWYYTNSGIQTSTNEVKEEDYKNATSWGSLLNVYQSGTVVNDRTRSVAVKDALQYGVARLQCTLKSINVQLKDAKNEVVNNAIDDYLPLTSVIVGAQHMVGFDFKPRGVQSDVDGRFIYDADVGSRAANGSWTVSTLVLQTYDGEKVPVVLEFQNNTVNEKGEGNAFTGKDGIIYPGCKFYLVAMLDPANMGTGAYAGRVFTQDYTTAVEMKITSLANAYSCMPDLLSPRLEIGVQVQTKWIQSTTTTVKLN